MARDRHGRGVRGPLAWPAVPVMAPRSVRFDSHVLDAVEQLEQRLGRSLEAIEVAVEDVPPSDPAPWEQRVPLGRSFPAQGRHAARVVIYRRPVESRAESDSDLADLVDEVIAEQIASLIGIHPDDLKE